jgi:DUF917 family protein
MDGVTLAQDMLNKGFKSLTAYATASASDSDIAVMPGGMGEPSAISGSVLDFVPACTAAINELVSSGDLPGPVTGLTAVEAGPVNAMLAVYIASQQSQWKLYNCDGAGRAVPSLTNLLYDFEGPQVPFSPAGISNIDGTRTFTENIWTDAAEAENGLRPVIDQMGGAIGLCAWPQAGTYLRNADLNITTFSDAANHGQILRENSLNSAEMASAISNFIAPSTTYRELIWDTTLDFVYFDEEAESQGYDKGYLVFNRNAPNFEGKELRLYYLNENMFISAHASSDGSFIEYVATAPSIITPFFSDPTPPSFLTTTANSMIPYNTGDLDRINTLVGRPMVVAVVPPAASSQYSSPVVQTYVTVLNQYFNDYGFTFATSDIYPTTPT